MALHAGKDGTVKIGANTIAEIRSWNTDEVGENFDDTTMGDTARTHFATLTSWTGGVTVFWDETNTNGQGAMTINASLSVIFYPEGTAGGDTKFTGTASVIGIGRSADVAGGVEVSYELLGNGSLVESTV